MPSAITNLQQASLAAASLPEAIHVTLSSGLKLKLRRLSWIAFEALWPKLAGLLTELWTDPPGSTGSRAGTSSSESEPVANSTDPATALSRRLLSIPGLLCDLLGHCTELSGEDIGALPLSDVLALAAAALRHNFIETAGLRDFFAALGELAD